MIEKYLVKKLSFRIYFSLKKKKYPLRNKLPLKIQNRTIKHLEVQNLKGVLAPDYYRNQQSGSKCYHSFTIVNQ